MALNTIYKHLAESIKDGRDTLFPEETQRVRDAALNDLALAFAEKMEPKQPGSFDKAKFLELAGVTEQA